MIYATRIIRAALSLMLLAAVSAAQVPNVQISSPSIRLQNEEQVFICPTDSLTVIATWRDFRLGYRRCGIGRSTDGGATWVDSLNKLLIDIDNWQSDPTMTVDVNGNFICSYLDFSNTAVDDSSFIAFIRSTDKGISWQGPFQVTADHGPWFEDKQFITADRTGGPHDGNVYVAWARFPNPTRMMFARSTDGGVTFDDTVIVGPSQDHPPCGYIVDAGQFAQPIVGSDGAVYVFWSGTDLIPDQCAGYYAMKMSKSTDGGQTWPVEAEAIFNYTYVTYADGGINVYNAPAGDADISGGPYDGNIYISTTNGFDDGVYYHDDIVMIKSTDGGQTWLPPLRVNDDPPGVDVDQFHPWLIVNQDGVIVMIFYDQRQDPGHYLFDVFAAYSFDGGETFTTNHRITEVSSSPDDLKKSSIPGEAADVEGMFRGDGTYAFYSPMAGKIAEYIGVSAYHDYVVAVWTDTRNGDQDVFGAYYTIPFLQPRLFGIADGDYIGSAPDSLYWSTCWHESDVSYRVEIDDDPAIGSPDISAAPTDNKFSWTTLAIADGEYYWRVKAFRPSTDDSTEYSVIWSFILDTETPAAAVPVSPSGGEIIIDSLPTLVWSGTTNKEGSPEYFGVELSDDPAFGDGSFLFDTTVASTESSVTVTMPLPHEGWFYWRVNAFDQAGNESGFSDAANFEFVRYICGDADGDLNVIVSDAVFIVNYIFKGGPAPMPLESADVNLDGMINVGDAVYIINYIFKGGPPPCEPI